LGHGRFRTGQDRCGRHQRRRAPARAAASARRAAPMRPGRESRSAIGCDTPRLHRRAWHVIHPRPTDRACAWCATEFPVLRRPGRPRLYCRRSCRQRAYEHRHGFVHQRTVRPLPGQVSGDSWTGTGYERGGSIAAFGKLHALRTSVRPEGRRRQTLCGLLAAPLAGRHFQAGHQRACRSCSDIAAANPLRFGISSSNELSRLRSLLDDVDERRVPAADALRWIRANSPNSP
jgi:hypothetical protein